MEDLQKQITDKLVEGTADLYNANVAAAEEKAPSVAGSRKSAAKEE